MEQAQRTEPATQKRPPRSEPAESRQSLRGIGYADQAEAVRPRGDGAQADAVKPGSDAAQADAVKPDSDAAQADAVTQAAPIVQTADYRDASFPGIFLVGWAPSQVDEFLRGLAGMAGIRATWDPTTKLLSFGGDDAARMKARQTEGRWSQGMHDAWVSAIAGSPRHSVVIGAQAGDTDKIFGGYAIPANSVMVLDMMDIGTFAGDTTRAEQSFNLYWVMTHELLGHFYLGLGHGEHYESYDIDSYKYEDDETLQLMNEWRMDLGLPIRLQHPPRVEGEKRTYIFCDAFPGQPDIDLDATAPDTTVALPTIEERRQKFEDLRRRMAGNLSRPDGTDLQYYPEVHMLDDDSDAAGKALPGRGNVLPLLRWGSKGERVRLAQTKLNEAGASLDVDGDFRGLTHKATIAFQTERGLKKIDGLIGPETWSALLGYQVMTDEDREARRSGVR